MALQSIYVVDTNVLVDYVDIIPNGQNVPLEKPTIDLSHAHIVIPTAVIRELSAFKHEKSERGKAARIVLKRIRKLAERKLQTMGDAYRLEAPIEIGRGGQKISILPVHKNFKQALPFSPSDEDMDGQIILTTLSAMFARAGLPVDGTANYKEVIKLSRENLVQEVVLLTNDNGLAIRARERGITTSRYGYQYPEPYTGRRDIIVPEAVFHEFWTAREISREFWEEQMPNAPKLVANEFIVMGLENERDYPRDFDLGNNPFFENIGRYDADDDAIVPLKYLSNFPLRLKNAGQAIYAEALMDPQFAAVICTGPAGSGKTFMATVYGYEACKNGSFIGVTAVPCESHSKIGALPGDLDEKMDPDVQPLKNALRNYLLLGDSKLKKELENLKKFGASPKVRKSNGEEEPPERRSIKTRLKDQVDLIWNNWFSSIPIENARGRDFAYELAIYDEFQDQNVAQADTLIKRIGANGKIILTGDIDQIHAPYLDSLNNGLVYASRQLLDSPLVAQVHFTEEEVIRHPLVKLIAMRQRERNQQPDD